MAERYAQGLDPRVRNAQKQIAKVENYNKIFTLILNNFQELIISCNTDAFPSQSLLSKDNQFLSP